MEMKKKTILAVTALTFAMVMIFAGLGYAGSLTPPAAPAPTMKTLDKVEPRIPISQSDIPLTINTSGSYYLTEDVNSAGTAISVEVNDVTIDLSGYSLVGMGGSGNNGIRIISGSSNVEIRNGTIRNFGWHGIVEYSPSSHNNRLINLRVISNGQVSSSYYGIYTVGSGNLLKDCTVSDNLGRGINCGSGNRVTGNTVYNNGTGGIFSGAGCTILNNTAYYNGIMGIYAGLGCTLTGNTACNNGSYGIYATHGSTVTNNTAYNNQGMGIYLGYGCTATGNTTYANQGTGIYTGYCCMVTGNTVYSNNLSDTASQGGIYAYNDCLIKGNIVRSNKKNNIYVYGSDNAIEENLLTDSTPGYGIFFNSAGNFYANNRASGNSTNYGGNVPAGAGDGGGNAGF